MRRSLQELSVFFREAFLSKADAQEPGLLQAIDPRVKLVTLLSWLVVATWAPRLSALAALYGLVVLLAFLSRISMPRFLVRTWLFVPLFAGVMVLPAIFNGVTPGEPVMVLARTDHFVLSITRQGLTAAGFLVLRVATTVSWAALLVMTTRWERLLSALRVLGLPKTFLMVIEMMYRYIFLLIRHMVDTHMAMESRTAQAPSFRAGQRMVAAQAGVLLRQSLALSQEIYLAMCSRGYTGEIRLLDPPGLTARDYAWLLACAAGLLAFVVGVAR